MCKTCKVCNTTYKDIDANFSKCKAYDCGYDYLCKSCDSKRNKLRYQKYHDKELERCRRYRENTRKIRKERQKLYNIKYKEKRAEYYKKNKDIIREKARVYNQKETTKILKKVSQIKIIKKHIDNLTDYYIKILLKRDGYKDTTPEIIQSKREFLENKRRNKFLII